MTNHKLHIARLLVGLVLAGTLVGVLSGGRADALSPYVRQGWITVGDCQIGAGAQYDPSRGAAIGAAQAPCSRRHARTEVTVYLYWHPYSGGTWHLITTGHTVFTNSYGLGTRELATGAACGGGYAWWQTVVVASISGLGTYQVADPVQAYAPGC
jgi:hypothetical protein